MQETDIVNKHSDEIQEIITKVPSWIVRWGIIIFGGVLLMALAISAMIRYPDTIKTTVKIQTSNNAAETLGLLAITQDYYTKVKLGQHVNIQLKVYPADEYGQLKGAIIYIADEPDAKGLFLVKVKLDPSTTTHPVKLKNWMTGSAEIITQDITVLQRITKNLNK